MTISIALPDGSMRKKIDGYFAGAGLPITIVDERLSLGSVGVPWIGDVNHQKPQEIATSVYNGHFDVGIVGQDWIANWGLEGMFKTLATLPIGRSRNEPVTIALAVSEKSGITKLGDLPRGCEIATEYVELTKTFFERRGRTDIQITRSYGKTEGKVRFGAMGVVDVSESGRSFEAHRLRKIHDIMQSSVAIISNVEAYRDPEKTDYIECLSELILGAYRASLYVSLTANVPKDKLDEAANIMEGLKGPNKSDCIGNGRGWYTLESTILGKEEHNVILALLRIGVRDVKVERNIPLLMTSRG